MPISFNGNPTIVAHGFEESRALKSCVMNEVIFLFMQIWFSQIMYKLQKSPEWLLPQMAVVTSLPL